MKPLSLFVLLAIIFLSSCSKKKNPAPTVSKTGSVIINGGTYPTIIIGNQTWTSFNYTGGTGSLATADATYGNYYTLAQAIQIPLPTGWRIPTRADYNNLLANFTSTTNSSGDYVGDITVARDLADTAHFHSLASPNNSSGFSAYPGGEYDLTNKVFTDQLIGGAFLTSTTGTVNSTPVSYIFGITSDNVSIGLSSTGYYSGIDFNSNPYAYSLRFVKDNQ
jgi:uncharacterized protein (TIGR02145 family)